MKRNQKAGHRTWASGGRKVPGGHTGDIMSKEKRSQVMARIKGKNTSPELLMEASLLSLGLKTERHCRDLRGCPDFVFRSSKVAVFVDGSFWHGFRFPLWSHKLSPKWRDKIAATRARDRRNFASLRRQGWKVLRIWEHQVERSPAKCAERVRAAIVLCEAKLKDSR